MKYLLIIALALGFSACASKSAKFNQKSYDRQNSAAEKSLDSI